MGLPLISDWPSWLQFFAALWFIASSLGIIILLLDKRDKNDDIASLRRSVTQIAMELARHVTEKDSHGGGGGVGGVGGRVPDQWDPFVNTTLIAAEFRRAGEQLIDSAFGAGPTLVGNTDGDVITVRSDDGSFVRTYPTGGGDSEESETDISDGDTFAWIPAAWKESKDDNPVRFSELPRRQAPGGYARPFPRHDQSASASERGPQGDGTGEDSARSGSGDGGFGNGDDANRDGNGQGSD